MPQVLGSTLLTAIFVGSVAVGVIAGVQAQRQARKARQAAQGNIEDRQVMIDVSPRQARTIVLGRVRTVEGVRRRWVSGPNLSRLTMFVSVAGHEVEDIETVYFDDVPLTLDEDGFVLTSPYFRADRQTGLRQGTLDGSGAAAEVFMQPGALVSTARGIWFSGTGASYASGPLTVTPIADIRVGLSGGPPGARYSLTWQTEDGQFTARVRKFLGSPTQNVGAALAAEYPGNLSASDAFAGIAGVLVDIFYDPDIYPQGRPNVTAVVAGAKVYDPRGDRRTSDLYPAFTLENVDVSHAFIGGAMQSWPLENVDVSHAFIGGSLLDVLTSYQQYPVENVDVLHAFTGGTLTDVLISYGLYPVENVDVAHAFLGGSLADVLLSYPNWPTESVDVSHAFLGGTLT